MRTWLMICAMISFVPTTGFAKESVRTDGKIYQRVCRTSHFSEIQASSIALNRCLFVDRNFVSAFDQTDKPCPKTSEDSFSAGLLGTDCELWRHWEIDPTSFVYVEKCDSSQWAKIKERLLGKSACEARYMTQKDYLKSLGQAKRLETSLSRANGAFTKTIPDSIQGSSAPVSAPASGAAQAR